MPSSSRGADKDLARKIIRGDREVDEKKGNRKPLPDYFSSSPLQGPAPHLCALKMITDMERIGDQAADISEIAVYLADGRL